MALMSSTILAASRSPQARSLATSSTLTRRIVTRFVAGEDAQDAVTAAARLAQSGLSVTVDHLGEDPTTSEQAVAIGQAYLTLLDSFTLHGLAARCEVSIKPSALGLQLDRGLAYDLAGRIVDAATTAGTTVTVDMEGSATVDATLELVASLRSRTPSVGAVVQAMLHRTVDDCRALAVEGSRVRLVKGAYAEPAAVAHTSRQDVDRAYLECLRILMEGGGYPMIATHDPQMIDAAQGLAARTSRGNGSWELQMLYGIRVDEQARLAREGHLVRVYIPYGQDWFGYFMRRLAERPANLQFFLRSFLPGSAR